MNRQVWVCGTCGRTIEAGKNNERGWLIGSHKDPEKRANGEMVIRCPQHITDWAILIVRRGRKDIRK